MADIILTEADTKRFWLKTRWNPWTGCLEWTAGKLDSGYGVFWVGTTNRGAHRVAWAITLGPIPEGLCALHKCDTRACVNVDHLFLGTRGDNARDMCAKGRHRNQVKTHCAKGHELSGENLRRSKYGRSCRECGLAHQRAYKSTRRRELCEKQRLYMAKKKAGLRGLPSPA